MAFKTTLFSIFCILVVGLSVLQVCDSEALKFVPQKSQNVAKSSNPLTNFWSSLRSKARSISRVAQAIPPFNNCPCYWPPLCLPISKEYKSEVVVFSTVNNASHWVNYDWKRITTIVMFGYYNANLMCLAHKHGVRVVSKVFFPLKNITNSSDCDHFVKQTVQMVQDQHLDGVNVDIEDPIDKSDFKRINAFSEFVKNLAAALKAVNKDYKITFDTAWSPECIDDRCYDSLEISKYVDYLFVMSYDEQSQMLEKECIARANSGFNKTVTGVLKYIQKNIPRKKLVLGVPWYGYDYPCLALSKTDVCTIKKVPFRGAPCSDAAGKQLSYTAINDLLAKEHLIQRWNNATSTPFFNYKDVNGTFHQVWFDNVKSLSMKYAFAVKIGLGGVGMWNADCLNYTAPEEELFKSMWEALPEFPSNG